jgi:acyl-coenzyme A synthetase/AMP-(fatty) acid ligase
LNFARPILHYATTRPEIAALVDGETVVTYRALAEMTQGVAGHLAALGAAPGRRVGMRLMDTWRHVPVMLAVARLGAAIVPMDWHAKPHESARIAATLALDLAIIEPDTDLAAPCPVVTLDDVLSPPAARRALPPVPDDGNLPLFLAPSSGTTGIPKYVVATHRHIYFRTMTLAGPPPLVSDRFLLTMPLCFASGYQRILAHLLWGNTSVFAPMVSAEEYVGLAHRHAITIGVVVPTIVRQLLQLSGTACALPAGMRLATAAAPLFAEEKREAASRLTADFYDSYSSSAMGGISQLWPRDLETRPESVGQPYPLVEAQVVDEHDRPLPPNVVGRLRVRGPTVGTPLILPGTAAPRSEEIRGGWYYPGETAVIDDQSYVFIKGRSSELIIRGGAKIHPVEIETVLHRHADVADVAVLGRRGHDNEESIIAFVVAKRPVTVGALVAHCRAQLSPHKVPHEIRFLDRLPTTSAGKTSKLALVERLRSAP